MTDYPEDAPELTREELQTLVDEQGLELYRAQDRLAFVGEMCDSADRDGTPATTAQVRKWLAYTGCGGVIVWTEAGKNPDCGFPALPPRQHSAELQRRVQEQFGWPPVKAVELMHAPTTPDGPTIIGGFDADIDPPDPPVFCHHPNVVRSSRQTMAAGWGLRTLHTASCPDCPASAESFAGEPALGPWLLDPQPSTAAPTEARP